MLIVDLHVRGLVIIVGAGAEGMRKIDSLLAQGCDILVFDRAENARVRRHVEGKRIKFVKAELADADFLEQYRPYMVLATTGDRALNRTIADRARSMGCLAYASDDPGVSDFSHPSVIDMRGVVRVAISTGGRSPIMARRIRQRAEAALEGVVRDEDVLYIRLQEGMRELAQKRIGSQAERRRYLYGVMSDRTVRQLIKDGRLEMAQRRAVELLDGWK